MKVKGWRFVLGVLLGAAVAAFVLKAIPPALIGLAMLAGLGYGAYVYRRRRRAEREAVRASALGLHRSDGDPFGLVQLPLLLLGRDNTHRMVEDVMFGTWGELDVKVFDFRYGPPANEHRYACALLPTGRSTPALTLEPRTFFTADDDRGSLKPVPLKDRAFEEAFDVRGADAESAEALLIDEVRGWIEELSIPVGFELNADMLLCYAQEGQDPLEVLKAATGLLHRLPPEPVRAPGDPG